MYGKPAVPAVVLPKSTGTGYPADMAYEIHITRADTWAESPANPILPDEWKSMVERHPALSGDGSSGELSVILHQEGAPIPVTYNNGRLTLEYREDVIETVKDIAQGLRAVVMGEEGEQY